MIRQVDSLKTSR